MTIRYSGHLLQQPL